MGEKTLVGFDFDHTIIDANTDIEVQKLSVEDIPIDIRQLYSNKCWTDFMQAVFELLHKQNVTADQYKTLLYKIPFVRGMDELLRKLGDYHKDNVEVIIISDSNSMFIEEILKHHNLHNCVTKIFTNPAWFDDDGCLRIKYYHEQSECDLSTKNLCKGMILKDYVKSREKDNNGVKFSRIIYVGDGKNDLCPSLRLNKKDHVFARRGYTLETMLKAAETKDKKISATVHYWQTAYEISEFMGYGGCTKEPHNVASLVVDNGQPT